MVLRPHRTLLFTPRVQVKGEVAPLAEWLASVVFDHFVRDETIGLELAPDDDLAFEDARRDDLLRLDLDLSRDGTAVARLTAQRREGSDEYASIGAQSLSDPLPAAFASGSMHAVSAGLSARLCRRSRSTTRSPAHSGSQRTTWTRHHLPPKVCRQR